MVNDVAKRLQFDSMDITGEATAGVVAPAAADHTRAHDDLVSEFDQQVQRILHAAQQASDGAGANDLKRLQRQFQALKASYINIDMKRRFMEGLESADLDVVRHDAACKQQEVELEEHAQLLRDLKAQTEEARTATLRVIQDICEAQQDFTTTTAANAAQLEDVQRLLQEQAAAAAAHRPVDDAGPSYEECQARNEQEAAKARQLEDSTATTQASVDDLGSRNQALAKEVAALTAEVKRLEEAAAEQQKSQSSSSQYDQANAWCTEMLSVVEQLSGVRLLKVEGNSLRLSITTRAPATQPQHGEEAPSAASSRVCTTVHELAVQLQPGSVCVSSAALEPATLDIQDLVAECRQQQAAGQQLPTLVQAVRWRLQLHWQRECLLESAAAAGQLTAVAGDGQLWQAVLGEGVAATVLVPWAWPCAGACLQLQQVEAGGKGAQQLQQVVEEVNADAQYRQLPLQAYLRAVADKLGDVPGV